MKKSKTPIKPAPKLQTEQIVSKVFENGHFLELLYAPRLQKTSFAYWDGKNFSIRNKYTEQASKQLVPVKPENNLIKHRVIKFPSYAQPYQSHQQLLSDIKSFIHKYVDLDPDFEALAAHYVLLTWVYDRFRELPYLRLIGDYGTGKTRFLLILGALCYKSTFASGASTTSPIFHILNSFGGTLVLDEADFRFSDAKSEITKILNSGNAKGFPVLRSEGTQTGTYSPRAFLVFGPKIIATREHYEDPALESRFIYERTKAGNVRKDIPINLPDEYESEAENLRNQLLMFRFQNWHGLNPDEEIPLEFGDARISQIYRPLLTIAKDKTSRNTIVAFAKKSQEHLKALRSQSNEAQVLKTIANLVRDHSQALSMKRIAQEYQKQFGGDQMIPVSAKWIGGIVRSKLHLSTTKRNGVYVIDNSDASKLSALFERYDIET